MLYASGMSMKALLLDVVSAVVVSGAILSFFVVERMVSLGAVAKRPAVVATLSR